jgi:hypothetical protein
MVLASRAQVLLAVLPHQIGFCPAGAARVIACGCLCAAASAADLSVTNALGGTSWPSALQCAAAEVCSVILWVLR